VEGYTQYTPEWAAWTQAERQAEARRLYEEAGFSPERPLRVQILYNTHENHRTIAVAVSSMWNEVLGIETELHQRGVEGLSRNPPQQADHAGVPRRLDRRLQRRLHVPRTACTPRAA
jgi:ABC-type oligopeptide transport system substrate-binding subunit